MISLPGKKREKPKGGKGQELHSAGAIVWQVQAGDPERRTEMDCVLGISNEFVVLIDPTSQAVVFNCFCRDVIGWTLSPGVVTVYYQRGEFVALLTPSSQPVDQAAEIVQRLEIVTTGCKTEELTLRRNSVHHLAFQVNCEAFVTEVERNSYAEMVGLKPWSRLVRICEEPSASLTYKQMSELLRKAEQVKITVIPPDVNGKPRMSFSELYKKSIEEIEKKPKGPVGAQLNPPFRATNALLKPLALPLLRVSSLQETGTHIPSEESHLQAARTNSLDKPVSHPQRTRSDASNSSVLMTSTPDLILAVNPQHLPAPQSPTEESLRKSQLFSLRKPLSRTTSVESYCSFSDSSCVNQIVPNDILFSCTSVPSCKDLSSSSKLYDIDDMESSNPEWQSITDIASFCESLVESISLEADGSPSVSQAADVTLRPGDDPPGVYPEVVCEKMNQLEAMVKKLKEDLMKEQEKEDKALLQAEVQSLRQNSQGLRESS
eukprot:gi/632990409/ref/XP_007884155.1/ PREDICTED: signal-induced proliferation-associated protein 1-like [Callorhinchus milii]